MKSFATWILEVLNYLDKEEKSKKETPWPEKYNILPLLQDFPEKTQNEYLQMADNRNLILWADNTVGNDIQRQRRVFASITPKGKDYYNAQLAGKIYSDLMKSLVPRHGRDPIAKLLNLEPADILIFHLRNIPDSEQDLNKSGAYITALHNLEQAEAIRKFLISEHLFKEIKFAKKADVTDDNLFLVVTATSGHTLSDD